VVTFADGGAFATRDLNPAGPPGFGSWRLTRPQGFAATFFNAFGGGPPGSPSGILKVTIQGNWLDNHIKAKYHFEVFDAGNGDLVDSGDGTLEGDRIQPGI
jgi:hypothetical protein